ncbi:metallophosphoesterase family protein [Roseovarius aestuariivivens]|uniref:metallophosphoesterase family protein n=1 Tax=Roseovarius aestuariivivens TaxID=1888910 RepID=UPI00143687ED|nr:metallophosphoesterase [Roseovarius aestuariivivens]
MVFYTDIHADGRDETSAALAMAAEAMNAQNPDLVLCGGDLISGGFASNSKEMAPRWNAYMNMARAIRAEHHAVLGNHDLVGALQNNGHDGTDPRSDFKRHLGLSRTYDSFEALGYRFILLDSLRISNDSHRYEGWISSEQTEWIRELLASTPRDVPIVLLLHMPLLTTFFAATKGTTFQAQANRVVLNNVEILDLFARHNLILLLQGHLHVSEAIYWRGSTFLTGGALCGGWWRGPYYGTARGFTSITLKDDRIEWEYLTYDSSTGHPDQ